VKEWRFRDGDRRGGMKKHPGMEAMALWSGFYFRGLYPQPGPLGTSPSGPGRPLWQRALTILPVRMGFRVIDGALAALTDANSMARIGAPDPFSNGVLIRNERILIGADALIAWVHRSDAHGVVTGRPIRSWEDLWDWRLRP
jgi:hypothetical protein